MSEIALTRVDLAQVGQTKRNCLKVREGGECMNPFCTPSTLPLPFYPLKVVIVGFFERLVRIRNVGNAKYGFEIRTNMYLTKHNSGDSSRARQDQRNAQVTRAGTFLHQFRKNAINSDFRSWSEAWTAASSAFFARRMKRRFDIWSLNS